MTRTGKIDPETWTPREAAEALRVRCVFTTRSAPATARRYAEFTRDPKRAAFWQAVSRELEAMRGAA